MTTLSVGIASVADAKARLLTAAAAAPAICFSSYDDMHRVLAPSRLAIVGRGPSPSANWLGVSAGTSRRCIGT